MSIDDEVGAEVKGEVDSEVIAQKAALRAEMKARRAGLNESQRARASWLLCTRLAAFLEARPEKTIGVYLARPAEISLDGLIGEMLHQGKTVAAPRADLETGLMRFWRIQNLDEVEFGPWQVRQPSEKEAIDELPLIIVPGLAFDRQGGRLGTGGGWYDRFLRDGIITIGVGFECQIVAQIPLEAHDRRVQYVGSEMRLGELSNFRVEHEL